jgi:hypothetical protein
MLLQARMFAQTTCCIEAVRSTGGVGAMLTELG